jgi:hypothetical protein
LRISSFVEGIVMNHPSSIGRAECAGAGIGAPYSKSEIRKAIDFFTTRTSARFVPTERMSAANSKAIEDIAVGDTVWAWHEVTGDRVERPVVRLFRHADKPLVTVRIAYENRQECIEATTEHPFWVPGRGWVAASALLPGDSLLLLDEGASAQVMYAVVAGRTADVFNFEVDGAHNYFVGEGAVLVHNRSDLDVEQDFGPQAKRPHQLAAEGVGEQGRIAAITQNALGQRDLPLQMAVRQAAEDKAALDALEAARCRTVPSQDCSNLDRGNRFERLQSALQEAARADAARRPDNRLRQLQARLDGQRRADAAEAEARYTEEFGRRWKENARVYAKQGATPVGRALQAMSSSPDPLVHELPDNVKSVLWATPRGQFVTAHHDPRITVPGSVDDHADLPRTPSTDPRAPKLDPQARRYQVNPMHETVAPLPVSMADQVADARAIAQGMFFNATESAVVRTGVGVAKSVAEAAKSSAVGVVQSATGKVVAEVRARPKARGAMARAYLVGHLELGDGRSVPGRRLAAGDAEAPRQPTISIRIPEFRGYSINQPYQGSRHPSGFIGFGSCFVAGTPVWMADGSAKPIESVQQGDLVAAWDEALQKVCAREVVRLFRRPDEPIQAIEIAGDDGSRQHIDATTEHPFWVEGKGWVAANELLPGDVLKGIDSGARMQVVSCAAMGANADVFNFEVAEIHNYFVGTQGILVHNMSWKPAVAFSEGSAKVSSLAEQRAADKSIPHLAYQVSYGRMLTVASGDFSLEASLAEHVSGARPSNWTVTELNRPPTDRSKKHQELRQRIAGNIGMLREIGGAEVVWGVDVTNLGAHHQLVGRRYDTILAFGPYVNRFTTKMSNTELVNGLFASAPGHLATDGELVLGLMPDQYKQWGIQRLADNNGFARINAVPFNYDHPGLAPTFPKVRPDFYWGKGDEPIDMMLHTFIYAP